MVTSLIAACSLLSSAQPTVPASQAEAIPKCKVSLSLMPRFPISEDAYLDAVREQVQLGVQGTYPNIKWSDLSDANSMKPLQDQIGISKFVGGDSVLCVKILDTTNRVTPSTYQTLALDDPKVVEAWEETILEVAKNLPKNLKAIALGNEVDVYLKDHPKELPAFISLVKTARALLKGAGVKAPVGVITTYEGAVKSPELVKQIHSNFDIVMMTYYPIDSSFQVMPVKSVGSHFEKMVNLAGGKPLFLTEVGCPAGVANGSSEDTQAEFVGEAFKQLRTHDGKIVFANFFIQTDFPDPLVDMLEGYYRLKDDRFRSYLATLGLTKSDGTRRKAFSVFKRQLRQWTGE
jgi:hypothetical protein